MANLVRFEGISESEIRDELARLLASPLFIQSERLARFLRFTIESVLNGQSDMLKEYVIGSEVYDRKPPYHPSQDSIVRTEARRLRSKLKDYYESEGSDDPVLIYFRPGSYVPVLRLRDALTRAAAPVENPADEGSPVEGKGVSIAVIPFKDLSGLPASCACATAITDELTHELMRTEGCRVTSASSVTTLIREALDLPQLAQKLGVQIFFEGNVRQEGQSLRVTARIINADGFQLWSQRFEIAPEPHQLFHASEQIVRSLVNRTRPELSSVRKLRASASAVILETYPTVLGAEAFVDEGTPGEIRIAITRFREVSERAPRYPRPLYGIAQSYYELALRGVGVCAASISEAKAKAKQATELDPELIQAHGCFAALLCFEWNWQEAKKIFDHALGIGPHVATYRQYALFHTAHARFEEAGHYLRLADPIDPFSRRQKLAWARFCHLSRGYEDLLEHSSERSAQVQLPPEGRLYLALIYIEAGRLSEAAAIAREVHRYSPVEPALMALLAEVFAGCGEVPLAQELVRSFRLLSDIPGISRYRQSLLSLALGDAACALSFLSAAFKAREPELIWLAVDPRLDTLRQTPDFLAMTEAVMQREKPGAGLSAVTSITAEA